jgi:hypothetical protein
MPMKPEVKARWVAALRSGEYEQGRGRLLQVTDDGRYAYCALGVLCDLASTHYTASKIDTGTICIPHGVFSWAFAPRVVPCLSLFVDGEEYPISMLNDLRRLTFSKLADLIEAQL